MSKKPQTTIRINTTNTGDQVAQLEFLSLSLPLEAGAPAPSGYITRHIDLHLTAAQADGLHRYFHAAQQRGMRLANGNFPNRPGDAVRLLFERIHELAMESA